MRSGPLRKLWLEQVTVPRECGRFGARLLHVPYFGSPLFAPCPVVVTVHDLIMLVLPQHRGSALVQLYTRLVGAAARRARFVIADSECTKRDLVRLLAIPEERIRVVYLGVGDEYRPVADPARLAAVRDRYGLGERFLFYAGGLDWRKNVVTLIEAAAVLPEDCELAIAGKSHSQNPTLFPDLPAAARRAGVADRVRFLGAVPAEDLPALYSAAALFVFPSRYEGFGLTPLEAMACGAPVLASNASSLPEVVGDGGLLFDPDDRGGLAQLVRAVIENRELARDLRGRGLAQASGFNWRRTAEATLGVYREAGCAQG